MVFKNMLLSKPVNKCSDTIFVAYQYKNLDEKWILEGYKKIEPNEKIFEAVKTRHNEFKYCSYNIEKT